MSEEFQGLYIGIFFVNFEQDIAWRKCRHGNIWYDFFKKIAGLQNEKNSSRTFLIESYFEMSGGIHI